MARLLDGPVIVEGVSALHPDLAPLYDLRIWVESDAATVLSFDAVELLLEKCCDIKAVMGDAH